MFRVMLGVASLIAALSAARSARAGDRGLYITFVDARQDAPVDDPARDALEREVFECGAVAIDVCRRTFVPGRDRDTGLQLVHGVPLGAIEAAVVRRAAVSAAGRRALARALVATGPSYSLDGVVLYQPGPSGRVTLVLVNLTRGTTSRLVLPRRVGAAEVAPRLDERTRRRMHRFLAAGWVP